MVKYFYQENTGHARARNVCVENSKGEYLAWLDSDDYYLPGKLTAQMNYLREHSECEIVFTRYENFYENEESKTFIKESYFVQMNPDFDAVGDRCCPCTLLAPREVILRVGWRNESLKVGEDMEWLNRARIVYGISVLHCTDAIYMRRRLHKSNLCFERFSPASEVLLKRTIAGYMRSKINV
jgi:glycosyltransferase involved in cell wall biosynthesis